MVRKFFISIYGFEGRPGSSPGLTLRNESQDLTTGILGEFREVIEIIKLVYNRRDATLPMTIQGADFAITNHGIIRNADKPGKFEFLFGRKGTADKTA